MNTRPNFTNNSWTGFNWLLAALALCLTVLARAGTQPAAIPFADIGARATAGYQGDALGVTATSDGARLRCDFQKLAGHATPEGLWLESTKPGAGQLRLVAVAVGRGGSRAPQCALTEAASSVRSAKPTKWSVTCANEPSPSAPSPPREERAGERRPFSSAFPPRCIGSAMFIGTVPQGHQAPLGAPCTHGAASFFDMPLLTELETTFSDVPFSTLNPQPSTVLPATGTVSVQDKLVRFTRPGLIEEYSVSVDGVRQDFTIVSPPRNPQRSTLNQSARVLRLELALSGARAEATASGARLKLEGSGRALAYSRLRVEDATGRELRARLEVLSPGRLAVTVADAWAVYPVRIDPTFSDADWVSLNPGLPGADSLVDAIVVEGTGNVYVGGLFTWIGAVPANYVAKWDGSAWSALGSGMDDRVLALAVSGTNLYAGGRFTTAGGVVANRIAEWDGTSWLALGSGLSKSVFALAVNGTTLYAAGSFTTAGEVPANRIAKWDGSAWSALGSGMNDGGVLALALRGTNLYAGGAFTTAGGVQVNNIAKWDGSAWSALGSGMNSGVQALALNGTDLYAGGYFTSAGGVSANYIAKWDGSAWSALGSGIWGGGPTPYVGALAVIGSDLYVGGYFSTAGGLPANYIAKWNGSDWSALRSGMGGSSPYVYALAANGTDLYAGGEFSTAGGEPANCVAKWDRSAWSALRSGMNSGVQALALNGSDLYAGGYFTSAGGVSANYIAKWDGSAWSALGSGMGSLCFWAGGGRHHSLRRRKLHHGGRGDGELDRQMGRQRLVGPRLGAQWRLLFSCLCASGDRD